MRSLKRPCLTTLEKSSEEKNAITGKIYKTDATIMAWQLANEPRGYDLPNQFMNWISETSSFIKRKDKHHLVCLGTEGNTSKVTNGNKVLDNNNIKNVDYITMHIWAQNWSWFNTTQDEEVYQEAIKKVDDYWSALVKVANQLNKPVVLEEFSIARDKSPYQPTETTYWRDRFNSYLFSKVANSIENGDKVKGLNFWTYSGEGRPARPGEFWRKGNPFIGDPAHELQGWYGVYNTDEFTIKVIKEISTKIMD